MSSVVASTTALLDSAKTFFSYSEKILWEKIIMKISNEMKSYHGIYFVVKLVGATFVFISSSVTVFS